jgi:hypothetical protein
MWDSGGWGDQTLQPFFGKGDCQQKKELVN